MGKTEKLNTKMILIFKNNAYLVPLAIDFEPAHLSKSC